MGKIISGGYKGISHDTYRSPISYEPEDSVSPNPNQGQINGYLNQLPAKSTSEMLRNLGSPLVGEMQEGEDEGWGSYLDRNIAKTPFLLAKAARSGLGIGNLTELAARKAGAPEAVRAALQQILPSYQQAGEEQAKYLPKRLTETRPGDEPIEFLATELPLLYATGGLSSLGAAGRAGLGTAGALAGGTAGKYVGGELGEALGDREIGEVLGALGGGVSGGLLARKLRPSQAVGPKVEQANKAAFEKDKAQRMADAEKDFSNKIQGLTQEERKSALSLPKEKSAFESAKKDQINGVRQEIVQYDKKIQALDDIRKEAYDTASKLRKGKGNADNIKSTIREIESSIQEGVSPADRKSIMDNLGSIENAIKNGELGLNSATNFQKNYNDQIYNFGASNSFKRQMNKMTTALNEFIQENGSPEHNQNWMRAEQATRELKSLQKGRKDFVSFKNQQSRDLHKEKFSPEKELSLKEQHKIAKQELKIAQDQREKIIGAIGKESYEGLVNSKSTQEKTVDALEKLTGAVTNWGLGGLGAALGYFGGLGKTPAILLGLGGALTSTVVREARLAKEVLRNHPDIFNDYMKLIKKATVLDATRAARQLDDLGSRIEQFVPNEETTPRQGRIISGGYKG